MKRTIGPDIAAKLIQLLGNNCGVNTDHPHCLIAWSEDKARCVIAECHTPGKWESALLVAQSSGTGDSIMEALTNSPEDKPDQPPKRKINLRVIS